MKYQAKKTYGRVELQCHHPWSRYWRDLNGHHVQAVVPLSKSPRYPLHKRLGGSHSRSRLCGEEKPPLPSARNWNEIPRQWSPAQPTPSRLTRSREQNIFLEAEHGAKSLISALNKIHILLKSTTIRAGRPRGRGSSSGIVKNFLFVKSSK
jgi:hypothetical protein